MYTMPKEITALTTETGYEICESRWVVSCCWRVTNVRRTKLMTKLYASPGGSANIIMTHTRQSAVKDKT